MSFSFNVTADTKAAAAERVKTTLDGIVDGQPVHAKNRDYVQASAEACINVLADLGEDQVVSVSVSGSLRWRAENEFTSANISVSAALQTK